MLICQLSFWRNFDLTRRPLHFLFTRLPLEFFNSASIISSVAVESSVSVLSLDSVSKGSSASTFNFRLDILFHVDLYFELLLCLGTDVWYIFVYQSHTLLMLSLMWCDHLTHWVKWSLHLMYCTHLSFSKSCSFVPLSFQHQSFLCPYLLQSWVPLIS